MIDASMSVISIDRSRPFNPNDFIGQNWTVNEQDEHSLALTELDPREVRLETTLKGGEQYVQGEEKLRRLKQAGYIRLDAKIFQRFWEDQRMIPEIWKAESDGLSTYIFFDGTVFQNPDGDRCVLFISWEMTVRRWFWYLYWLKDGCAASDKSAILQR